MKHLVFEGVDFGGKGICINAIRDFELVRESKIFDVDEFQKRNGRNPSPNEIPNEPLVIIYSEPTFAGVGKLLRERILKDKKIYHSVESEAEAFALDRRMLFEQTLGDKISGRKDLHLLGSRGIVSSLVYQAGRIAHERRIPYEQAVKEILSIPGNKYVWENHMPKIIGITVVNNVDELIQRGHEREKKDEVKYETARELIRISEGYNNSYILDRIGGKSSIEMIDAEKSVDFTKEQAINIWRKYIEN